jgi:HlyD family secretion protein
MKSKVIKATIIGLIVVVIGVGGFVGYNTFFNKTVSVAAKTTYYTTTVKKTSLSKTIQGTGSVYAGTTKAVAPNNNGNLSGITVKVGDSVSIGQQLFVCSSTDLTKAVTDATKKLTKAKAQLVTDEATLATANAQLVTDQATLTAANAQLATDKSAAKVDSNAITQDENDVSKCESSVSSDQKSITDATTKISDDKDTITDDTSSLTDANTAVSKQTVTSPIAGVVTTVDSANGDSGQASKSVVTVSDMNTMKVKVSVDELDISSVQLGQTATIKFDAISGKSFTGAVESIAQTGTTSNNVTTYDVVVSINSPTGIRLGMNANVTIAVVSKDNAIVIPVEALVESNSKKYVRVQDTSDATNSGNSNSTSNGKMVEITTGIETINYIEVTNGVTEGQTILVQLPSSSSSTNTRNSMGGPGGDMSGGMPNGGAPGGMQGGGTSSSKSTTAK